MKETILSNCERNFILRAAQEIKRLDGRKLDGFRNLKVHFGQDWGLCYASLGETKVLTQVTCEIQEPKTTDPNEGLLFINVELSSMAAPHFESGRPSDLSVHINRLLEKCIKDSRAVDLESLCIVAEEKVWVLRVNVNILNHDGGLVDCASVSALAALAHFKRPDITTNGEEITVHSVFERDPIPITLHHYPVCVSFALLNNSENIFADPTSVEERVSDANLTFGINAFREICCLHLGGVALIKPKIILTCSTKAALRAKEVVDIIKDALNEDAKFRQTSKSVGFSNSFEWNKVTALSEDRLKIQLSNYVTNKSEANQKTEPMQESDSEDFEIINLGDNCAELNTLKSSKTENRVIEIFSHPTKLMKKETGNELQNMPVEYFGEGGISKWEVNPNIPNPIDSDSCSDHERNDICELPMPPKKKIENIEISGDSEEEVVILNPDDISNPHSNSKKMSSNIKRSVKSGPNSSEKSSHTSVLNKPKKNKRKKGNKFKK